MSNRQDYYSVKEVQTALGFSQATVLRYERMGLIPKRHEVSFDGKETVFFLRSEIDFIKSKQKRSMRAY